MAISGIRTGETGISLALDNNYMEPIATTLVGSGGVNQITFNDIPQNYKHLQLRVSALASWANAGGPGQLFLNFNSDVGSNYTRHELYGDGSSALAGGFAVGSYNYISIQRVLYTSNASATSPFGVTILDILDYTNINKNKTTRLIGGFDNNGSGEVYIASGLWINTQAITKIDITPIAGNLIRQYSRFSLYGIKG